MGAAVPTETRLQPTVRIGALDGVRGIMAIVVVLWHGWLIVAPTVNEWILRDASPGSARVSAMLNSDLLSRAIVVFFLLSGFVVSMPMLRPDRSWRRYYVSRLLRLYLPAWASIVLSITLILAFPRSPAAPGTWLSQTNATGVSLGTVLSNASLMTQWPLLNNPLWSLTWEVLFSLLLPLYLLVARATRRHWLWAAGAVIVLAGVAFECHCYAVTYLLSFLVGAIAAAHIDTIAAAVEKVRSSRRHALWWWLVFVGAVLSAFGYRVTQSLPLSKPFTLINHVLSSTTMVGYVGFLLVAIGSVTAARFLSTRIMQWGGAVSFSLYLVHVPVLVTLAFAFPGSPGLAVLIGIPTAVVAAALFSRFIEWPAHRFARRMGVLSASSWYRIRANAKTATTP